MQTEPTSCSPAVPPQKRRIVIIALNERGMRIGETHQNARIPDAVVDRIRELHEDFGYSYVDICKELSLALTTVRKICAYQRRADTATRWERRKAVVYQSTQSQTPTVERAEYVWKDRTFVTYKVKR